MSYEVRESFRHRPWIGTVLVRICLSEILAELLSVRSAFVRVGRTGNASAGVKVYVSNRHYILEAPSVDGFVNRLVDRLLHLTLGLLTLLAKRVEPMDNH